MTKIKAIVRHDDTLRRSTGHGDNWHMSWAKDDKQYVSMCDGSGWPTIPGYTGKFYNTRVYAIQGNSPDQTFEHLPGFPDLFIEEPPNLHRYYGFGILALDETIYHYLSTPNRSFNEPDARFIGAKLVYSPDLGKTWKNQDGSPLTWEPREQRSGENMVFFNEPGECFTLLTMLQMGKNYEHNQDGYVYVYAPNGNTDGTMNQLVMFRVPQDAILDRSAYEYFGSLHADGTAQWTNDIEERGVVHTFPAGWVNSKDHPYAWHPSVVYNAGLGLYMMTTWGMPFDEDGLWFAKPSYLGFWTAPQPWGPWTQVHEELAWTPGGDEAARAYQPQIVPKWIAEDGKTFWLVWTDFQLIDGERPYYNFNYQSVDIVTG